jgi:hypothetical protein
MEHIGKIIKIDRVKGFGSIYSEIDKKDYNFETISLREEVQLDDIVGFNIEKRYKKKHVTAIRKIITYQTKNGLIFISGINSQYITNGVESYLDDIFEQIPEFDTKRFAEEFPYQSIVGKSICVPTNEEDDIFYAKKNEYKGHTRFVLNREPIDSNHITVVIQKERTHYILINAYFGKKAPPEPWDKIAISSAQELSSAIEFWSNHALIFRNEEIIEESKTNVCPWALNQPDITIIKDSDNTNEKMVINGSKHVVNDFLSFSKIIKIIKTLISKLFKSQ